MKNPSPKSRIVLVDDHPIMRHGLAKLINDQADLQVSGEAGTAPEALGLIAREQPDLVILDLSLAGGGTDGLELCKQLHDQHAAIPILVLSMHDESLYAERALHAGARGYVMKHDPQERVLDAVRRVLKGGVAVSAAISEKLLQGIAGGGRAGEGVSPLERLTDRELEVFQLIGQGLAVREIAERLFLSPKTVEAHKEHIKQKLNLKSSGELRQYAIQARSNPI